MKNHIKNYIKIMGLAAVPFGTAQAEDYEIKVTQKYTCDPNDPKSEKDGAMHFTISVSKDGGESHVAEIVWPNDKEYPNPIYNPSWFVLSYLQELRKEKVVGDGYIEGFRSNLFANELEFARFYGDDPERVKKAYESFMEEYGRFDGFLSEQQKKDFNAKLLSATTKRDALQLARVIDEEKFADMYAAFLPNGDDEAKKIMEEVADGYFFPKLNLPKGCTCAMYLASADCFYHVCPTFWLMRNSYGYRLAIFFPPSREVQSATVLSDVPTMCFGGCKSLYIRNEVLCSSSRKFMYDNFVVTDKYRRREYGDKKIVTRFFIRQGHHADEFDLDGGNAAPGECDYFVQTDSFGEKITDVWEKGKRLNTDDIKDRKFKDPKEIVKFLEERFGKKEEAKK